MLHQALLVALVVGLTGALAWAGLGSVAKLLFLGCAAWVALRYHRRSPVLYLTATFWFWTIAPFARRLVDYRGGFDPTNVILAAPNLMAALMLIDLAKSRGLLRGVQAIWAMMILAPVLYGISVSLAQGQIFPAAVGAMDWVVPLGYYAYAVDNAAELRKSLPQFKMFLLLNGLVVVPYGLYQAVQPTPWDLAWAAASGIEGSAKAISENGFHLFSTLNSGEHLAAWSAAMIILAVHFRSKPDLVLLPGWIALLVLTLVRSFAADTFLCLLIALLTGTAATRRGLAMMAGVVILVLALLAPLSGGLADRAMTRITSLEHLSNDDSALTRAAIWAETPRLVANHPIGLGIGALGRGAVVSDDADLVSIDFGPLAVYLSLGWVAGTLYMAGLIGFVSRALLKAYASRSSTAMAFALVAFALLLQLPIINVIGFSGAILWFCAACAEIFAEVAPARTPGALAAAWHRPPIMVASR